MQLLLHGDALLRSNDLSRPSRLVDLTLDVSLDLTDLRIRRTLEVCYYTVHIHSHQVDCVLSIVDRTAERKYPVSRPDATIV